VAILSAGFFMLNIARIFLGISILSFVIMVGSCASCNSASEKSHSYQLPNGRFVTGGVSSEAERTYGMRTIASFGVSFIALLLAGIAYGRHQAKEKK
jgi:ABC-type phosphate/phosphonate transport system substrate-binding protein